MKTFKTIVIIILAVMLILSASLNTFILTMLEITDVESFKQVLLCRELLKSLEQVTDTTVDTDMTSSDVIVDNPVETALMDTPIVDEATVIYEDTNIKVTCVKQELSIFGPTIKFLMENKTTTPLDISFTNVHIDGYQVDLCGVYVSALEGDKKTFETLYLYESDYEDFTSYPSLVEFTIKIQDSTSWYDVAESEPIQIEIHK
jgi:hypothetical protein